MPVTRKEVGIIISSPSRIDLDPLSAQWSILGWEMKSIYYYYTALRRFNHEQPVKVSLSKMTTRHQINVYI